VAARRKKLAKEMAKMAISAAMASEYLAVAYQPSKQLSQ